jgi:hypothetical protein
MPYRYLPRIGDRIDLAFLLALCGEACFIAGAIVGYCARPWRRKRLR